MDTKKIYLTKQGLDDLKQEYDEVVNVKRPKIVKELSQARDQGDLSENGAYTAAKEELAFIDGRIEELEILFKQVEIIKEVHQSGGQQVVNLGSQVTLTIDGKKEVFSIVGEWEADPTEQKISHESPLGKALIGKSVGDQLTVDAPAGKMVYTIVSVN